MIVTASTEEPPAGIGFDGGGGAPPINLLFQNLIPFLYANQTLEIDFNAQIPCSEIGAYCTFPDTMMTTDISNVPHFPTYFNFPLSSQVRRLGGSHLVQSIGENFKEYVRTIYESQYETVVTNIRVYIPGVVTKVQILDVFALGTWLGIVNPDLPLPLSGDSSIPPNNNYITNIFPGTNTTYVFLQPLTIEVTMTGEGVRYFTLKSQISSTPA